MKIIYYAALALGFLISPVRAELKIDVNGAMREPMPIAFPQMSGSGEAASYGERIREVVIADLERSGMGMTIMESFSDQFEVQSQPGQGTTVRMIKQLQFHE